MKKPKVVEVEYIESGTFQGGEEDASLAGIERGESCLVIRYSDFTAMWNRIKDLKKLSEVLWKRQ